MHQAYWHLRSEVCIIIGIIYFSPPPSVALNWLPPRSVLKAELEHALTKSRPLATGENIPHGMHWSSREKIRSIRDAAVTVCWCSDEK
jgi:hypothetical protein